MHLVPRNRRICLTNAPFGGALGAKLYAGIGSAQAIQYRPEKVWMPRSITLNLPWKNGSGQWMNDPSLATVNSPTNSFSYTVPAAWFSQLVYLQVREFQSGWENEQIGGVRAIQFDSSGDVAEYLSGSYTLLGVLPDDGPCVTVQFRWVPDPNSLPVSAFVLSWVSGPHNFGTITLGASSNRIQNLLVTALTPGTYSSTLTAWYGGSISIVLGTVNFTVPGLPTTTMAVTYEEAT